MPPTGAGPPQWPERPARWWNRPVTPPERLFVAVWPSPSAVTALADEIDRARPGLTALDLRWQPPQRWHLTLAFLGPADPDHAARRLARVPLPAPGPVRLAGSGTFGPVLWVGVEHGPWLSPLARAVQEVLHVEDRRFRAHVTVARGRGRSAAADARTAAPALAGHAGPTWVPDRLTLVRSVTGPRPRYDVVGRWSLPTVADSGA